MIRELLINDVIIQCPSATEWINNNVVVAINSFTGSIYVCPKIKIAICISVD